MRTEGPSRVKRIIWRTERDHLSSSPRKRGPRRQLGPRFRGDDEKNGGLVGTEAVKSRQILRLLPKRSFSLLIGQFLPTDRGFVRDGEVPFTSVDQDPKALFDMQ